jgi:hypothetical protein
MKNKLICAYDDNDYTEEEDWDIAQDDWGYIESEANEILDSKDYVRVEGMTRRWNGTTSVDTIITETTIRDIIDSYIRGIDRVMCEVYEDRVEFSNCHHDGTNNYTFYPFSFYDLSRAELKERVDRDEYNYDRHKSDNYYCRATKAELVEYIEQGL